MNVHYHKIEDIESISKMLKERNLTSLEIGTDQFTKDILTEKVKSLSASINEAKAIFKEIFNKELESKILISLLVDSEKSLRWIYIKDNKIESKMNFVKREKLEEIIDFPDFSKILNSIKSINELGVELNEIVILKDFIQNHSDELIEFLMKKIDENCRVNLKGWDRIQNFLSTILLIKSFTLLKQVEGVRADSFISEFKRKGFIHIDEFGGIRLNEEILIKKILKKEI